MPQIDWQGTILCLTDTVNDNFHTEKEPRSGNDAMVMMSMLVYLVENWQITQ